MLSQCWDTSFCGTTLLIHIVLTSQSYILPLHHPSPVELLTNSSLLQSEKNDKVSGKVNLKFWLEAGPIENIQSYVKMMTFREFRLERSEVAFLKFFFQSAQILKNAVIVVSNGSFTSVPTVLSKLKSLIPETGPCKSCHVLVYESSDPEGGAVWSLQKGFDFSVTDPLYYRWTPRYLHQRHWSTLLTRSLCWFYCHV